MRSIILMAAMLLYSAAGVAAKADFVKARPLAAKQHEKVYIVQMREDPVAAYTGGVAGISATRPAAGQKIDVDADNVRAYLDHLGAMQGKVLAEVGANEKIYSYSYSFNGFAAKLTTDQVEALRGNREVLRIWEDELLQPQTNTSPDFLGLTGGQGPWQGGLTGEDVIVAVIDSGIWPEHPSFADVRTPLRGTNGPKRPYGPPPARWQGTECVFGNDAYNPLDAGFDCNNKLLGARFYADGIQSFTPLLPEEYLSARDQDGHGSHVASTAAGNSPVEAAIGGETLGKVSGMAPRARVAVYKVCWNGSFPPDGFEGGCASSDSMAAIDQAVADGVDVINFSIGGPSTSFGSPDDIAFLFAADAGVFVAAAQGNDGPDPETTGTPAGVPWLTSVGAISDDQVFNLGVDVSSAAAGVSGVYEGVEAAISVPFEDAGSLVGDLVLGEDGSGSYQGCGPLTNGAAIAGNIALIQRGSCAFSDKFLNAQTAGATALVVFNNSGDPIIMGGDPAGIGIPGLMIGQADGELIAGSLLGGEAAVAGLGPDILISKENSTATFSSRGPNGGAPDIIKPDVSAPGVQILAAQTPTPNDGQTPGELFQIISGTSMASPHVAGLGALLTQAHPDWTPEMIRSALMTTANPDLKKSFGDAPADPFDVGAGLVSPRHMFNPGLVYQAGLFDYLQFLCGSNEQMGIVSASLCGAIGAIDGSDLNLPSIGVAELVGEQTVTRTVTRVADFNARHPNKKTKSDDPLLFTAQVSAPAGVDVSVSPSSLNLAVGESASYEVTFTTNEQAVIDSWVFGDLVWRSAGSEGHDLHDNFHRQDPVAVRSPIAVRAASISAPGTVAAADAAADGSLSFDVKFGSAGDITAEAGGLAAPLIDTLAAGIEVGGATLHFFAVPPGTRVARFGLFDESVGDGTGADDLDLQVQGPDTAGYPLVGTSGSPTSTEDVTLIDPAPGVYAVFVIRFATQNAVTDYALHNWNAGPNLGNVTASDPGPVSVGQTATVDVDWSGLAPGTRYRGLVSISNADGELALTLVEVDTAP